MLRLHVSSQPANFPSQLQRHLGPKSVISKTNIPSLTRSDPTNGVGVCGLGPKFCGNGCVSNCDRKGECDPGWGPGWSTDDKCPLNVCCSEFGFCGTTKDFCGGKTVPSPNCGGKSAEKRLIGYYEGWNVHQRPCGSKSPALMSGKYVIGKRPAAYSPPS